MDFMRPNEEPPLNEEQLQRHYLRTWVQEKIMGPDITGPDALHWIVANDDRLDVLLNDPQCDFYNRLEDESAREGIIAEIKAKLYH